ncbi:hypothetical protein BJ170DRAFT_707338 [Xylariales sp. AK1849]|nr:hypothetical protein BJ170DRAFT_707338 [Xylariales sp. AK1849]
MASESPEDAWGEDGDGYGNAEQYSHQQQTQEPTTTSHVPASGDSAEDSDYDPESVTISAPAVASPRPSKKPKKAGGFIVGSSDDEDDHPTPATNSPPPDPPLLQSHAQPPSQTLVQQSTTVIQDFAASSAQVSNGRGYPPAALPRLPVNTIGILEDRVINDPRGDLDAWLALIEEHRKRNMIQDTRAVYERFLQVFPQAGEIWVQYLDMELSLDNFAEAERIFQRTLMTVPSIDLWTAYLNYIRRRNDLNDATGQARNIVNSSYEFVLDNVGQDRDSGRIWQDYIQFIKNGPGQVGGTSWQDMQKMDLLRKAYQRAICIPMGNLNILWKEYDQFELGLNKVAGRKFLQERSPSYMSARSANTHLDNITRGLRRTTIPRLAPAPGFDGDQEYLEQVDLWRQWIAWEKEDPLVLNSDEPGTYRQRIIWVYKQALLALRFWPELWVDAAEWCFENDVLDKEGQDTGLDFLIEGVAANPESSLLALKHADRIESSYPAGEGDAGQVALSLAVRAPFDLTLTALYDMIKKLKDRETAAVTNIENDPTLSAAAVTENEDEDEGEVSDRPTQANPKMERIKAVRDGFAVQIQMLSQQISYLWIALARAFRRIQGQGKGQPPSGVRGIFTEARTRGRLTSDVYVAIAHIEWDIYQDPVATKIFERGAKLFPEDEHFMVAYLKHLHSRHDATNARVVFSQTVKRFKAKPELVRKLKPLYAYFHSHEAKFGELAQIKDLEKQMAEAFPEDPALSHFAARFSSDRFNPVTARAIISPSAQMRPKNILQSVERASAARDSPHPSVLLDRSPRHQFLQAVNSPKRPFQADDFDDNPPRKLARGISPLKGAAGRRLDQQRRGGQAAPIARDITFLMTLIPPAHQYNGVHRYRPDAMTNLISHTTIADEKEWKAAARPQTTPQFSRDSPAPAIRQGPYLRSGDDSYQQYGAHLPFAPGYPAYNNGFQ